MVTPEKALEILTSCYTPLSKGGKKLVLSNFVQLTQISDLSLGSEVTLRGNVTYVSPKRGDDLDIHFDLAPPSGNGFVVCEIQNADEVQHGQPLQQASAAGTTVEVTGVLRIFPEHVYASAGPTLAHIFEIHPIREVKIDGTPLDNITMDCPAHENFTTQHSMHEIVIQDDGTMVMASSGRPMSDNIIVEFDGTDLTMIKPPFLNVNYVFGSFYLSFDQNSQFQDGQPFLFEFRGSSDLNSVPVKSVVIPGTAAYDTVKGFLNNPPTDQITVAALRSLSFQQLMNSTYEVVFCPVYRFQG
jgi:hypothetical protein